MAGNRQMPTPPAPAEKEHHPSMAAPTEHGEETRTIPPVPAVGKPVGAAAQEGLFPDPPPPAMQHPMGQVGAVAPSPEGLLAKAAHSLQTMLKPDAKPSRLPGMPGDAGQVLDPSKEVDHNIPTDGDVQKKDGGIEVRAIGLGFIDNQRKAIGDVFRIRDEKMLGEWMEPTDEKAAKKHREAIEEKYAKQRKEAAERSERRLATLGF